MYKNRLITEKLSVWNLWGRCTKVYKAILRCVKKMLGSVHKFGLQLKEGSDHICIIDCRHMLNENWLLGEDVKK